MKEFPVATTTLAITIFSVAWFVTGFFPDEESLSAVWWDQHAMQDGQWWRAITAILAHGGILHMAFNLLALISFGPLVERRIGSIRFALLFLGAGFSSLLAHAIYRPEMPVVGASGSIFGILGLLMILSPRLRMSLFFVWDTSILTFGALYAAFVPILLQLGGVAAFIAHEAHLGGMVFGTAAAFAVDWKKALHVMPAALTVFILLTVLITSWIRFLGQVECPVAQLGLVDAVGCVLIAAWSDTLFFLATVFAILGTAAAYTYIEVKKL